MTTARQNLAAAIFLGLALALAGCEPSMDQVLAEHAPAAERVFEELRALAPVAAAAPPLAEDRVALGGVQLRLHGDDSNALFVREADLAAPELASGDGDGGTHSSAVAGCGEALRGEFHGAAVGAAAFLDRCARAEYAIVLRPAFAPLSADGTFDPHAWAGEVRVFRLTDHAALGGFRVATDTRGDTTVLIDRRTGEEVAGSMRTDDPSAKVFVAIDEALKRHLPGVLDGA